MDKLKVLITVLEKQMLRAAEVGCPRLAAVVQGAAHKLDLSPFAKQISQSLVKVILGTNEENIKIAKKAFQTMIKSCKEEDQLCKGEKRFVFIMDLYIFFSGGLLESSLWW